MTMMITGAVSGTYAGGDKSGGGAGSVDEKAAEAHEERLKNASEAAKVANVKADGSTNFVDRLFNKFEAALVAKSDGSGHQSFTEHLNDQIDALGKGDSSDPQKLARYQKAIMMFTVHTNAQTSMVKSISDLDKGIVRDFN